MNNAFVMKNSISKFANGTPSNIKLCQITLGFFCMTKDTPCEVVPDTASSMKLVKKTSPEPKAHFSNHPSGSYNLLLIEQIFFGLANFSGLPIGNSIDDIKPFICPKSFRKCVMNGISESYFRKLKGGIEGLAERHVLTVASESQTGFSSILAISIKPLLGKDPLKRLKKSWIHA